MTNLAEPCCSQVAFVHSHPPACRGTLPPEAVALPEDRLHSTQEPVEASHSVDPLHREAGQRNETGEEQKCL